MGLTILKDCLCGRRVYKDEPQRLVLDDEPGYKPSWRRIHRRCLADFNFTVTA